MTDLKKYGSVPNSRSNLEPSNLEQPLPIGYIDPTEPLMQLYARASSSLAAAETSSVRSRPLAGDQLIGTTDDAAESAAKLKLKSASIPLTSGLGLKMSQATQSTPAPRPANWRSAIAILAISLGAFGAGGITSYLVLTKWNKTQAPVTTQAPATTAQAPATAQAAVNTVPSKADWLFWPELLQPGAVSPRGKPAGDVTADEAFRIANAKIHGLDGKPDIDEARYWLRVGVADTLASGRLSWALTQLGTLYARPQASPSDFAIARGVWEVAAAARDPVALCFLAMLEEGGFGTAPNREVALTLYRQAREAGACERAGSAIERLSR